MTNKRDNMLQQYITEKLMEQHLCDNVLSA